MKNWTGRAPEIVPGRGLVLAVILCGLYPLDRLGPRPGPFSRPGQRLAHRAGRRRRRVEPDRPAILGPRRIFIRVPRPRDRATTPRGPAAATSGPLSKDLVETVRAAGRRLPGGKRARRDGALVPADAVTASGSGLDPHISPENARLQAPRVARARGLAEADVRARIEACTEGRTLGILGEPRVNVLRLNLALDGVRDAGR